jgi:hypothetical protein
VGEDRDFLDTLATLEVRRNMRHPLIKKHALPPSTSDNALVHNSLYSVAQARKVTPRQANPLHLIDDDLDTIALYQCYRQSYHYVGDVPEDWSRDLKNHWLIYIAHIWEYRGMRKSQFSRLDVIIHYPSDKIALIKGERLKEKVIDSYQQDHGKNILRDDVDVDKFIDCCKAMGVGYRNLTREQSTRYRDDGRITDQRRLRREANMSAECRYRGESPRSFEGSPRSPRIQIQEMDDENSNHAPSPGISTSLYRSAEQSSSFSLMEQLSNSISEPGDLSYEEEPRFSESGTPEEGDSERTERRARGMGQSSLDDTLFTFDDAALQMLPDPMSSIEVEKLHIQQRKELDEWTSRKEENDWTSMMHVPRAAAASEDEGPSTATPRTGSTRRREKRKGRSGGTSQEERPRQRRRGRGFTIPRRNTRT